MAFMKKKEMTIPYEAMVLYMRINNFVIFMQEQINEYEIQNSLTKGLKQYFDERSDATKQKINSYYERIPKKDDGSSLVRYAKSTPLYKKGEQIFKKTINPLMKQKEVFTHNLELLIRSAFEGSMEIFFSENDPTPKSVEDYLSATLSAIEGIEEKFKGYLKKHEYEEFKINIKDLKTRVNSMIGHYAEIKTVSKS